MVHSDDFYSYPGPVNGMVGLEQLLRIWNYIFPGWFEINPNNTAPWQTLKDMVGYIFISTYWKELYQMSVWKVLSTVEGREMIADNYRLKISLE